MNLNELVGIIKCPYPLHLARRYSLALFNYWVSLLSFSFGLSLIHRLHYPMYGGHGIPCVSKSTVKSDEQKREILLSTYPLFYLR